MPKTQPFSTAVASNPPVFYGDYTDFMKQHTILNTGPSNSLVPTHSRMPGEHSYGGKFHIPPAKMELFYQLYYNYVLFYGNEESLIELRGSDLNRNIVLDFDFKYDLKLPNRCHTEQHLLDLVSQYGALLIEHFDIPPNTTINMYVMEKPGPRLTDDNKSRKDGIHLFVGMKAHVDAQLSISKKLPAKLEQTESWLSLMKLWTDGCEWDTVIDKAVVSGSAGWMLLYGSNKPKRETCSNATVWLKSDVFDWMVFAYNMFWITKLSAFTVSPLTVPASTD